MTTPRLKASFYTLGCRLNQAETSLIASRFRKHGYNIVDFGEPSDVCIINSCTVTEQADAKCRQVVRQALRRNPDTYVAVVGCYAQTGAEALQNIEGIDLIVGTQEKINVLDHIVEPVKNPAPVVVRKKMARTPFTIDVDSNEVSTTRANLKIQDGCDFMCSFCVIPFARGRARSRAFWDIQREAMQLIDAGHKELVLTGVNIGIYQFEEKSFLDVLNMLLKIPGLERLRISSVEPTTIPEKVLDLMADSEKLCPHLHIPVQSGSDRVLEQMRRLYSRTEFLKFIERAEKKVPDILIGTDLMVGFPNEDDHDFEESCDLLDSSPLAYAHVFTFSERSGTAANRFSGKVDPIVKKARSKRMHRISEQNRDNFYKRFIGKNLRVLTEETDAQGRWLGYSDNYIKVAIDDDKLLENQLVNVRIGSVQNKVAVAMKQSV
ncbi:MAG: tRNA (N(6)-L-threonylcarbamoyladenosine(37)-C(2))-methylthiotransferase MtaB [bacterium]